jgi:hypothetical protein
MAPGAPSCSAVTGAPARSWPTTICAEAAAEVGAALGEGDDRHDLAGLVDLEEGLARDAVERAAEADDELAQGAVVDGADAGPGDAHGVEAELVAVAQVGVEHGGEEVVGGADGVAVAGHAEVDGVGGDDLGLATAGAAALAAEHGAERGLAQADDAVGADLVEAHAEGDRGDGLALAERGGGDGGDDDELALARARAGAGDVDLGEVVAVGVVAAVLRIEA